ncbi:MAG: chloride channel protein [Candidatus Nanopelagicales bacterium]|nr:hypothetical protein [Candidatus Nanopelagicales bacterium]
MATAETPSETPADAKSDPTLSRGRAIAFGILIAVISFPLGYAVLQVVQYSIEWVWVDFPRDASEPLVWLLALGLPTFAGVLVAWFRQHGNDGHNPMLGIAITPLSGRDYVAVIGAILATLIGGMVLGPEVAMVSTGAVVGTAIATRAGMTVKQGATIGASAAVLALFAGPIINGTFSTASTYRFDVKDLVGAVGVAAVTAAVLTAGRFLSIGILKLHGGDRPKTSILAISGFLVGALGLGYYLTTGHELALIMTSGESETKALLALSSAGAIAVTVAFKWLAYSISMGGGFRGGPFFPAIYIGAGIAAVTTSLTPDYAQGAMAAGITAAVVYLAHPKWLFTVVLGIVLGMLAGGPQLIPIAVVAALVAKLLPEVKATTKPTGDVRVTEAR